MEGVVGGVGAAVVVTVLVTVGAAVVGTVGAAVVGCRVVVVGALVVAGKIVSSIHFV